MNRGVAAPRLPTPASLAYAGWAAFATYLLAQALAGPVVIWNDSRAYAAVAAAPLWSHAFWWGQRPPMTPFLIKVVGMAGLLTAQALISAASWGALAWTVGRLADPGWRRLVATWLVLGFATALPITLWNRSMLSESLSMSLLALVVAGLIWTARRVTWPRVLATSTAALCFAATRDAQIWTVAMLGVAVAVLALPRRRTSARDAARAGAMAVCLIVVAGVAGGGTLASHRTTEDVTHVFFVRVFPYPARVTWFADHGMPEPHQIDQLAAATTASPGAAKVVAFAPGDPSFRPLEHWLDTEGPRAYLQWLVTHPGYVITEQLSRPERSYNFAHGNLTFYAAKANALASPLTPVVWPPLVELAILSVAAICLAVRHRAWRQGPWRAVAVLAGLGLPAMLIAWHGDGQEVTRHTVEGLTEFRLGIWILLVLGLVGRSSRSGRQRKRSMMAGESRTSPPPPGPVEPAPVLQLTSRDSGPPP